jgi:hypothetical protein
MRPDRVSCRVHLEVRLDDVPVLKAPRVEVGST